MTGSTDIAADIVEHARRTFPEHEVKGLMHVLGQVTTSPRLQRCIVVAARGRLHRFKQLCELAAIDYRDLIMVAEYSREDRRIFDFDRPIPEARIVRSDEPGG